MWEREDDDVRTLEVARAQGNPTITQRDASGKIIPLWLPNKLGAMLRKEFGNRVYGTPVEAPSGQIVHERDGSKIERLFHSARFGEFVPCYDGPNTVTSAGFVALAALFNGQTATEFKYVALGDDDTAAAVTQTALIGTEFTTLGLTRVVADDLSSTDGDYTNDVSVIAETFTATGTAAVKETGLFDAASAGNMYARYVFPATVNMVNTNTLAVSWQVKHSA